MGHTSESDSGSLAARPGLLAAIGPKNGSDGGAPAD
jgi:hypothetical protein